MKPVTRRKALYALGAAAIALPLGAHTISAQRFATVKAIPDNDPAVPIGGNAQGDLTIVTFLDYNCPFCRLSAPILADVVTSDGNIRLLYRDWPVLTEASVYGAQLAIAANLQGHYEEAHRALMAMTERRASVATMAGAVRGARLDWNRLTRDLDRHKPAIDALIKRNLAAAAQLGIRGTPSYLIGNVLASAPDRSGFGFAIAKARAEALHARPPRPF